MERKDEMVLVDKFKLILLILGLSVGLTGCQDNPGTWQEPKVKVKVMENLELTEATLTPLLEGGFEGSGKRADGETVTFTITQDADAHRMSWDAKGDRGFVEDGFYELK
jgi:hypothetical protein